MPEARNCVITMTHFKRPEYTKQSLAALAKCEGINHCLLLLHAEPVCQEVLDLLQRSISVSARLLLTRRRSSPIRTRSGLSTMRLPARTS